MKYVVSKVFVMPEDGPAVIRKKVAQKLGVRVTSLHVEILSKQWWRGKTGGMVELCVEAETNEFIHNTAYLPTSSEIIPLPSMQMKLSPVIVGFGLRGALTAFLFAKMGLRPIVLEEGDELALREGKQKDKSFDYIRGEGGLSVYSGLLFSPRELSPTMRSLLQEEGILFEGVDAHQYLPAAFLKSLVKKLHEVILAKGGTILFQHKYAGQKRFLGKLRGIYCDYHNERKLIRASTVVFTNGMGDDEFFIGCCIESSPRLFNQFVYGKAIVDAKFPPYYAESVFKPRGGRESLLMTGLPKATMLDVFSYASLLGEALEFNAKGKNALSYVGVSVSMEEGVRLMKEGYVSGKPFATPYSTISDFFFRRDPLKLGTVKPINASRVILTSVNRLLGSAVSPELEKAVKQFGKAFPYLLQEDALIGGLVLLRGSKNAENQNIGAKDQYFVSVRARKSLDFSFIANAAFQCVLDVAHSCKTH